MDCSNYGKLARVDALRFCGNSHTTQTNIMIFFSGDFMCSWPLNRHIPRDLRWALDSHAGWQVLLVFTDPFFAPAANGDSRREKCGEEYGKTGYLNRKVDGGMNRRQQSA